MTLLLLLVTNRKAQIAKKTYQEKLGSEFAPYTSKDHVPDIENSFWMKGVRANARTAYTSIRHRCVFLSCYSDMLCHETMYHGELSDMLCLNDYQRSQSSNAECLIQVVQIGQGK